MYCPPDQCRAQNLGVPNTKLRITAIVAVSGNGDFVPLFISIKHSVSSADMPDHHKKDDGYGVSDGWELILWCKSLTTKGAQMLLHHKQTYGACYHESI